MFFKHDYEVQNFEQIELKINSAATHMLNMKWENTETFDTLLFKKGVLKENDRTVIYNVPYHYANSIKE